MHAAGAQAHTAASKQPLEAYERFAEPRMEQVWVLRPNKQAIGKAFKKEGKPLQEAVEAMGQEDAACLQARCGRACILLPRSSCCCEFAHWPRR
jgi:glycyl-tRNA synthetase (class II)